MGDFCRGEIFSQPGHDFFPNFSNLLSALNWEPNPNFESYKNGFLTSGFIKLTLSAAGAK